MQSAISETAFTYSRRQWQWQRSAQITENFRRKWRNGLALIAVGIFSGAFMPFPFASHDADKGACPAAASAFWGLAAPVKARQLLAEPLPTVEVSKGAASNGGGFVSKSNFTQKLASEHPLTAIVHMDDGAAEQGTASAAKQRAQAAPPEGRQSFADRTASTRASTKSSILPPSRIVPNNKHVPVRLVESPAFVQQEATHGQQQAAGKRAPDCSCEFAGKCLPKGECVVVACIFVTFAIMVIFFLAWFLQWLSAIPAEWILAKRFRRRTALDFSTAAERTPVLKERSSGITTMAGVERADNQGPVGRERVDDSPETPISQEQPPALVDSSQGDTGSGGSYGSFAAAALANENGRL